MKKIVAVIFIVLASIIASGPASAESNVGQCMTYKAKTAKNGRLIPLKQVVVKAHPNDKVGSTPQLPLAMKVLNEKGTMVQVADPEDDSVIGWVSIKDLEYQDLRNCNMW